ncbi:MAG: 16S rRNA (cytidine(1402)-2'-O)-methyltransferase [Myxococcota bacterium]
MAGVLNVIATPIGNLQDWSARAQQTLQQCQLIVAEDTRITRRLLAAAGISCSGIRVLSCPAAQEHNRIKHVLAALQQNKSVGLVSDAGTPAISDPGSAIVQAAAAAGHRICVLPGPSSPIAAMMGAGLNTARFAFLGFLPRTLNSRKQIVQSATQAQLALVICESPQRVATLLKQLHEWCGPRRVVVARELTKCFETFHRGLLGEPLSPPYQERGEAIVVVDATAPAAQQPSAYQMDQLHQQAKQLLQQGLSPRDVTQQLRDSIALPKREIYQVVQQLYNSINNRNA